MLTFFREDRDIFKLEKNYLFLVDIKHNFKEYNDIYKYIKNVDINLDSFSVSEFNSFISVKYVDSIEKGNFVIEFYNDKDGYVFKFLLNWLNNMYDFENMVFYSLNNYERDIVFYIYNKDDLYLFDLNVFKGNFNGLRNWYKKIVFYRCFPVIDLKFKYDYSSDDFNESINVEFKYNGSYEIEIKDF